VVPVFQPQNPLELALAEAALQAHGVPYFVHNHGFGGLYPGVQIGLYNVITIMVQAARDVLHQFIVADLAASADEIAPPAPRNRIAEFIRLVVECAVAGWCLPRGVKRNRL